MNSFLYHRSFDFYAYFSIIKYDQITIFYMQVNPYPTLIPYPLIKITGVVWALSNLNFNASTTNPIFIIYSTRRVQQS